MSRNQTTVLVIDDDPDFHGIIRYMLEKQGCRVFCFEHPAELAGRDVPAVAHAVLLDWQLGDVDGTTLIQALRRRFPLTPVVFVTGHSSPEIAATSIKLGAFDFLSKPLDAARLMVTITKAAEHHEVLCRLQQVEAGSDEVGFEGLIGNSPQMQTIYTTIRNVAPTNVNVMICGESGTGKELIASAIHQRSDREAGPFVAVNMASIPRELAESTLFGHEEGAFTGADKRRLGAVGEAGGGTLFFDEITEMPIELQGKLLRFLQERVYRPVGGDRDIKSDARIVSATNRDPVAAVAEQRLREDLYYRLNVVPIELPPLREREGDVALLASHALKRFSKDYDKQLRDIEPSALGILEAYRWPGNVRQLIHVIQRVVVLSNGETLEAHMLPTEIFAEQPTPLPEKRADTETESAGQMPENPPINGPAAPSSREEIIPLEQLERAAIANALDLCDGSAYETARRLGISAATMYRRIKLYGIDPK